MRAHREGGARAQREAGGGDNAGAREQHEPVMLDHGGDDHLHLGGAEGAADAAARPPPKGK